MYSEVPAEKVVTELHVNHSQTFFLNRAIVTLRCSECYASESN